MNFPQITHIDQILSEIKGAKEFIHVKKNDYQVISYVINSDDTFSSDILKECRGIIFDNDGNLLRRSYHKFFNLNEKSECHIDNLDFSKSHIILEKLDGSMITPILLQYGFRWATRLGITDVSMQAEVFVSQRPKYSKFAHQCIKWWKCTPIFEWVSRNNRIVLDYSEDNLILTGMRCNLTGKYFPYQTQLNFANNFDIPCVKAFTISNIKNSEFDKFLEYLNEQKNIEGVVIRFDNGHMVKIKTEDYLTIHRAKDIISQEHDIAYLILTDNIDDVKSCLPENERKIVDEFEKSLLDIIKQYTIRIYNQLFLIQSEVLHDRKKFAIEKASKLRNLDKSIMFSCWDDSSYKNIWQKTLELFGKNCKHKQQYHEFKSEYLRGLQYNV